MVESFVRKTNYQSAIINMNVIRAYFEIVIQNIKKLEIKETRNESLKGEEGKNQFRVQSQISWGVGYNSSQIFWMCVWSSPQIQVSFGQFRDEYHSF